MPSSWLGKRIKGDNKRSPTEKYTSRETRGVATCAHGRLAFVRPSDSFLTLPTCWKADWVVGRVAGCWRCLACSPCLLYLPRLLPAYLACLTSERSLHYALSFVPILVAFSYSVTIVHLYLLIFSFVYFVLTYQNSISISRFVRDISKI